MVHIIRYARHAPEIYTVELGDATTKSTNIDIQLEQNGITQKTLNKAPHAAPTLPAPQDPEIERERGVRGS